MSAYKKIEGEYVITLFSNNCSKCIVLERKLKNVGIEFVKETDLSEIIDKGFLSLPVLKVDNEYLDFSKALAYVRQKEG